MPHLHLASRLLSHATQLSFGPFLPPAPQLYPLFGGRAPKPDCYRSPPPSPGRQMIQEVMGPAMFAGSSRPAKHADPFRMRPAPSDGTEAGVSLASAGRTGSRGTGQAPTVRSVHPEAVDMQPSDGIEGGLGGC